MLQFKRLLKADIIKLKSTLLLWIHIIIPLLGVAIFLCYYSFTTWNNVGKISGYLQTLCIAFPTLIGIIASLSADQEYMAGSYQNILNVSQLKSLAMISKIILFLVLGFLSTILAVIGFYLGFLFIGETIFTLTTYLKVIVIIFWSNIILYILHFFLSLRFSSSVSIGVGIIETLISALFLTSMGDGIWPFVPCSWSMRFVESLILKYSSINGIVLLDPDLKWGIMISITATILSIIILLIWFTKWEGNRAEE